ncbi:hypothetical protein ALC62_08284, partial [Cyphomyrmex costatus]
VHFKIYVPEIIKHHTHTKTVFIHIHKPEISIAPKKPKEEEPKKKKTYHKESHHEDWSSWSNYGYQNDQSSDDLLKNQKDHKDDDIHKEVAHGNPITQYHRDSNVPMLQHNEKLNFLKEQRGNMIGYSYPPQYEVKEDVKEIDNNEIEPYVHTYEEGYHKGGESTSGHTYSGDVTKFYDDKHEEGDHSAEEYKNESREKTHAGRYFVDDSEYQHNDKAEKRVSPKILARSRSSGGV